MSFMQKSDIVKAGEVALLLVFGVAISKGYVGYFGYGSTICCIKKIGQNVSKNINKICSNENNIPNTQALIDFNILDKQKENRISLAHENAGLISTNDCQYNVNMLDVKDLIGIYLVIDDKILINICANDACFVPNLLPSIYVPNIILDKMIKHTNAFKAICNDSVPESQGCHYVGKFESKNNNDINNDSDNDSSDSDYYIFEEFKPVDGGICIDMDYAHDNITRYTMYWLIKALCPVFIPEVLMHLIIGFIGTYCNEFQSNILNEAEKESLLSIFTWHLRTYELYLKPLYFSKSKECGSCEEYIKAVNRAGPTVTIFKTTSGYVFGGYIGRNIWHDKKHTIKFHDPTSLLFNVTTDTVFPLKRTDADTALIQTHPIIFIGFGWDGDVEAGFVEDFGTIVMGYERSPFGSSSYQYYNGNYIHGKGDELDIEAIEVISILRK